jgi:hypothetical protein
MIGDPDALDALVERLDSVRDEKRAGVKAAKPESGA